jgi:serine/threonine-protein kinase
VTEASLSRIGRYEIRRELGRGTMGIVYLAQDPALERSVALKTIDLAFAVPAPERAGFEQRFLAEGRVAGRLSHPGLVVVHDVERHRDRDPLHRARVPPGPHAGGRDRVGPAARLA